MAARNVKMTERVYVTKAALELRNEVDAIARADGVSVPVVVLSLIESGATRMLKRHANMMRMRGRRDKAAR